jgi:DNA (cytosine-5)-methyltransferase 1
MYKNNNIVLSGDMIRLATVFSGIGAVEHALARIGIPHKIVFACDNDPFVKKSFFANCGFA